MKNTTIASKAVKIDVIVMENLFYSKKTSQVFDLKGSERNRLVNVPQQGLKPELNQSPANQQQEKELVLLDENFLRCKSIIIIFSFFYRMKNLSLTCAFFRDIRQSDLHKNTLEATAHESHLKRLRVLEQQANHGLFVAVRLRRREELHHGGHHRLLARVHLGQTHRNLLEDDWWPRKDAHNSFA